MVLGGACVVLVGRVLIGGFWVVGTAGVEMGGG